MAESRLMKLNGRMDMIGLMRRLCCQREFMLLGLYKGQLGILEYVLHNPGCTQAMLAEILHADKAAIARRTKNLEAKGFLVRKGNPNDRRSQLLYPTWRAETLKSSRPKLRPPFTSI